MRRKKNTLLWSTFLLCLLSFAAMVLILMTGTKPARGEFIPPPFEESAVVGSPVVPEELGYSELDAEAFKASLCGVLLPEGDSVGVWLTNPEENTVWLKLRILDEKGDLLGETGLLRPGEYVQSVELSPVPDMGTEVTLKLMAYQPETYYSEGAVTLSTTIRG